MRPFDKDVPRHHKFHKLFNRNNVKLSYCCMSSKKNLIQKQFKNNGGYQIRNVF